MPDRDRLVLATATPRNPENKEETSTLFRRKRQPQEEITEVIDKHNPDFWRGIRPGSIVTLSDEYAMEQSIERGAGTLGLDYVVGYVDCIKDMSNLAEWYLLYIESTAEGYHLMIKIVDRDVVPILYFEPPEFHPGTRKQLIGRGMDWLFEPSDDGYEGPHAPVFCNEIFQTIDADGEEIEVQYRCKPQGTICGRFTRHPESADMADVFVAFAEYEADESFEDPELLLIERGGEDDPEGGLVNMLMGAILVFNDIDVLKA